MANENTPTTETNPLDVWEKMGVIGALLPHIHEVYPQFKPEDHDIIFAYVTWRFERSGCVGTFYLNEGEEEIELECEPVSTRWRADPAKPTVAMVFRVLQQQNREEDEGGDEDEDLTEGRWYAVPVGLAPTSVRARSEKTFQQMGLLDGRLPGFNAGEWDNSQPRLLNLRFRKTGGIMKTWFNGRKVVLDRQSRKPSADTEVACEVTCERLHGMFVTWRGIMTEGQQRVALAEASRLRGLTGLRRAASNTPAAPALPEATGNWDDGTDRPVDTTSDTGTDTTTDGESGETDQVPPTSEDQPAT